MNAVRTNPRGSRYALFAVLALIALMPFHAFLTTWAGSVFGARGAWQAWKEITIIGLAGYSLYRLVKDTGLRQKITSYLPNQLIFAYALLHLTIVLILPNEANATWHGLKLNLSWLVLFVSAQVIANGFNIKVIDKTLSKIIIAGGLVVAGFGVIQALWLPDDWLRQFGYMPGTILPFLPLGGDSEIARILSTLGGPNQLGQYLILPAAVILWRAIKVDRLWLLAEIPIFIAIYFSYSRSAVIGLAVAITLILLRIWGWRRVGLGLLAAALVVIVFTGLTRPSLVRETSTNYLLYHGANINSVSNNDRLSTLQRSVASLQANPLGQGVGTAGPAAFYLVAKEGIISENYYLQIALEVGLIGLGIFGLILLSVALSLWRLPLSLELGFPLLATLLGWSVINLVSHGWADSTAALIWWGSSGLIIRGRR